MPLDLNQLLKKAKDRGINPTKQNLHKPWYEESKINMDTNVSSTEQKSDNRDYINATQKVHKSDTNSIRAVHKLDTNLAQTAHKPDSNLIQTEYKTNTKAAQIQHKEDTKPDTKHADMSNSLNHLSGIQKQLIEYFYALCKTNIAGVTPCLSLEYISENSKIKIGSIKTSIQRLMKKGFLKKIAFKDGRCGWVQFTLTPSTYSELFQAETMGDLSYISFNKFIKPDTKVDTKPDTSGDSSSSVINIKTTTTNSSAVGEFPNGWQEVNYSSLDDIGFTQTHLLQLSKIKLLEPGIVQDSIDHFAFDLKHNNKASSIKGDPLNFFMGIVSRRGAYTAPSNYIDPVLEAMNAYHKSKEQSEKQKTEIEQKIQEIEFRTWHDSLSDSEIHALLPEEILHSVGMPESVTQRLKITHLKKHYQESIWPMRRREICKPSPN